MVAVVVALAWPISAAVGIAAAKVNIICKKTGADSSAPVIRPPAVLRHYWLAGEVGLTIIYALCESKHFLPIFRKSVIFEIDKRIFVLQVQ